MTALHRILDRFKSTISKINFFTPEGLGIYFAPTLAMGMILASYILILNFYPSLENLVEHSACGHVPHDSLIQKYVTAHCGLTFDLSWFILITYFVTSYRLYYLPKFLQFSHKFKALDKGTSKIKIKELLHNKIIFIILIVVFESLFVIAWWSPNNNLYVTPIDGDFSGILSYLTISILVIPWGSAYMASLICSVFISLGLIFPRIPKYNIELHLEDSDNVGGLQTLFESYLRAALIISGGITIALILYSELFFDFQRLLLFVTCFLIIDFFIVVVPFLSLWSFLKNKKEKMFELEEQNLDKLRNIKYEKTNLEEYKQIEREIDEVNLRLNRIRSLKTNAINNIVRKTFVILTLINTIFGSIYYAILTSPASIETMEKLREILNP